MNVGDGAFFGAGCNGNSISYEINEKRLGDIVCSYGGIGRRLFCHRFRDVLRTVGLGALVTLFGLVSLWGGRARFLDFLRDEAVDLVDRLILIGLGGMFI